MLKSTKILFVDKKLSPLPVLLACRGQMQSLGLNKVKASAFRHWPLWVIEKGDSDIIPYKIGRSE